MTIMQYAIGSGVSMVLYVTLVIPGVIRAELKKNNIVGYDDVIGYLMVSVIASIAWIPIVLLATLGGLLVLVYTTGKYIISVMMMVSLKGVPITWSENGVNSSEIIEVDGSNEYG